MKFIIFLKHLFFCVVFLVFPGLDVYASDGVVNIHGNLHSNTCNVSLDSQNIFVDMGSVATKQFINGGETSPFVPFVISLVDCGPAASAVSIEFDGKTDGGRNELLSIEQDTGAATGVGIAIMDSNKFDIKINELTNKVPVIPDAQRIDLNFFSQYRANGSKVSAGHANSVAVFKLFYY